MRTVPQSFLSCAQRLWDRGCPVVLPPESRECPRFDVPPRATVISQTFMSLPTPRSTKISPAFSRPLHVA